jgi:salicylate hydroxylase
MSRPKHILIAGGGIGGLVAALSLIQHGHRVTVLEQAAELKEIGAGVQIAANGSRVLINLGLEAALRDLVCTPVGKEIRLFDTGQTWKLSDLGQQSVARYGAPYWLLHRADLHSVLVDTIQSAAPGSLLTASRVTSFRQTPEGVAVQLADGRIFGGDALVGSDGVHSEVRKALHGNMTVNFAGRLAWRGVVPAERLSEQTRRLVAVNWLGPDANVVVYPLRGGELINFVGAMGNVTWTAESWTALGTLEDLLNDFQGWHPEIQEIIHNIDVPLKWAFRGREPLPSWTDGCVTLLGDAAHPTLPTLAQGANMAIEDGAVLARCIDAEESIPTALKRYEAARLERTTKLVNASAENAKRLQDQRLGGPDAAAYLDREYGSDKIAARYDWLFEYNALNVSI